ncbi:MAG: hypothetical protein GY826_37415 [Fuerstiella sp.]|nr:hypothetical protein [Fuerstiella sp.]
MAARPYYLYMTPFAGISRATKLMFPIDHRLLILPASLFTPAVHLVWKGVRVSIDLNWCGSTKYNTSDRQVALTD